MSRSPLLLLVSCFVLAGISARAAEEQAPTGRTVENLAAFARTYGYVRFFHPSEEAAVVDWDKVGLLGVEEVRDAADQPALRAALLRVFQPLAPELRLVDPAAPGATSTPAFAKTERMISWQYLGLSLSNEPSPYRRRRAVTGERGDLAPLFPKPTVSAELAKTIAPGLLLRLPLALPVDRNGKAPPAPVTEFAALQARLASIDVKTLTADDWRVRVSGVITVWNAFQHFHPYLDEIGAKWDEALAPALQRALRDRNGEEHYATLSELVAKTQDGHGYVYGRPEGMGGIPFRVDVVEGQLVVTGIAADAPFRKGDVIDQLDGVPALDLLRERERHTSGSPQLRRFRALNQFGEGPVGSIARFAFRRDGAAQIVEYTRVRDRRGYFANSVGEFVLPAFAEVRPGIFYVNLMSMDAAALERERPRLAKARGVIFDQRWGGALSPRPQGKTIQPANDIIPHLIGRSIQASPMRIPRVSEPDRVGWTYTESTWPVKPAAPRFTGHVVFINEPSVVSYGETCMAMIANHRLATLVGGPTAGCNGNVSYIPLPGGFRVMWTSMDVRRHDGSSFYTVGFPPDYPVARTLHAVQEGRDEYLEKAIAVIEQSSPAPSSPAGQKR